MELLVTIQSRSALAWMLFLVAMLVLAIGFTTMAQEPTFSLSKLWDSLIRVATVLIALTVAFQSELPHKIRLYALTSLDGPNLLEKEQGYSLDLLLQTMGPKKEQISVFLVDAFPIVSSDTPSPSFNLDLIDSEHKPVKHSLLVLPGKFTLQLRTAGRVRAPYRDKVTIVLVFRYLWPWSRDFKTLKATIDLVINLHSDWKEDL